MLFRNWGQENRLGIFEHSLVHFCGRKYRKQPNKASSVLKEILHSRCLRPSWPPKPLFEDYNGQQIILARNAIEESRVVKARKAERQAIIERISPGFVLDQDDFDKEFCKWLLGLKSTMISFTELSLAILATCKHDFGEFAIALKRDSIPAKRCEPVQYVMGEGAVASLPHIVGELGEITDSLLELGKEDGAGTGNVGWARKVLKVIRKLEAERLRLIEDAAYRYQHEWRFLPVEMRLNCHLSHLMSSSYWSIQANALSNGLKH